MYNADISEAVCTFVGQTLHVGNVTARHMYFVTYCRVEPVSQSLLLSN
jgi:hypothetical protein